MVEVFYKCGICGSIFDERASAMKCEAHGSVRDADAPPPGTIFTVDYDSDGKIFCGVITGPPRPLPSYKNAHTGHAPCWWFRGNGAGDDPNEEWGKGRYEVGPDFGTWEAYINAPETWRDPYWETNLEHLNAPAVKRAIQAIRDAGHTPYVIKDGEAVPLDDLK